MYHSVFVFPFFGDLQHTSDGKRVTFANSRNSLPVKRERWFANRLDVGWHLLWDFSVAASVCVFVSDFAEAKS